MEDLKDIIIELDNTKFDKQRQGMKIYEHWADIVDKDTSNVATPILINSDDILIVAVNNNVIFQELTFKKVEMIKKINSIKGTPHIKDIKFKIRAVELQY